MTQSAVEEPTSGRGAPDDVVLDAVATRTVVAQTTTTETVETDTVLIETMVEETLVEETLVEETVVGAPPMPWHAGTLVGFDLETTGTDPLTAQTVTAAVVYVGPDGTVGSRSRRWLADPGIPIPAPATAVHGITTEHARANGIPVARAVAEIADALEAAWTAGCPIVVFNAAYDLTLLSASLDRHGLPGLAQRPGWSSAVIIDPLVIDRAVDRYRRGKRTLQVAAVHYGVTATDAHSADGDAVAACLVARAIATRFPEVGNAPGEALVGQQAEWSRLWAAHFQAYLRSRGNADAVIDGTWPLRSG